MGVTQAALEAVAADDMAFRRHQVAHGEQLRRFGLAAQLHDLARELVAHDDGGLSRRRRSAPR